MPIEILVAEYPGDSVWTHFAKTIGATDDKILSVANALLGAGSAGWLQSPVPALDGKSPQEVLDHFPDGRLIVRSLIMRMP